jgi:hypothetical protein
LARADLVNPTSVFLRLFRLISLFSLLSADKKGWLEVSSLQKVL